MRRTIRALAVAGALLAATSASAQYYPQAPPPEPLPPPPPQPVYQAPPAPMPSDLAPVKVRNNVIRVQGGVSFAAAGYYCGYYYYYYPYYACSTGYSATWPNINAAFDYGLTDLLALSIGANVMWGSKSTTAPTAASISLTTWEPHLDLMFRGSPLSDIRGRFLLGLGVYVTTATGTVASAAVNKTSAGAAFRIGGGVSFFNTSPIGLGLDAVFEAGGVNGQYVSTFQLLAGPEFKF